MQTFAVGGSYAPVGASALISIAALAAAILSTRIAFSSLYAS